MNVGLTAIIKPGEFQPGNYSALVLLVFGVTKREMIAHRSCAGLWARGRHLSGVITQLSSTGPKPKLTLLMRGVRDSHVYCEITSRFTFRLNTELITVQHYHTAIDENWTRERYKPLFIYLYIFLKPHCIWQKFPRIHAALLFFYFFIYFCLCCFLGLITLMCSAVLC